MAQALKLTDLSDVWNLLPGDTALKAHKYTSTELGHADAEGNLTVGYTEAHGQSGFPEAQWK